MKLIHKNDRYEAVSKYGEWQAKQAGFRWDRDAKVWWTTDDDKALTLLEYADKDVRQRLKGLHESMREEQEASRAVDADIDIPVPDGLDYLPFQRAGIAYASRRPATLIGDEMGLGKTIQAIGVINADPEAKKVLVVCPASLRLNWQRELNKWLTRRMTVEVVGRAFPFYADVVIINYDILTKHADAIREQEWDVMVVDECHYIKNPKARRTKQVFGAYEKDKKTLGWVQTVQPIEARRRLFLTGTPIVNRPVELFPILKSIDKNRWGNWKRYTDRYCGAYHNGYAMDVSGASNLDELQDNLRATCMVRRLKADVLKELPAKRRQVIELPTNGATRAVKAEQAMMEQIEITLDALRVAVELAKASDDPEDYKNAVDALREGGQVAFTEVSKVRHQTALAKVPAVVGHLKDVVESGDKVVVFAHHLDVIDNIMSEFEGQAVKLDGRDSMGDRDQSVSRFQQDDRIRLFIGGIHAAGVGLTLTAAAHVVFAELDWVPGNLSQAEDRCHRIGQVDSVLVQHLVLEGSIDARMVQVIVEKQSVIEDALDTRHDSEEPDWDATVSDDEQPATKSLRASQIEEEAKKLSLEDIGLIHRKLQRLAALCDGAQAVDGMGFNKMDTGIGKQLASLPILTPKQAALGDRIVRKYHRQLEEVA